MSRKRVLYILGAGGHGKVVLEVARSMSSFAGFYFLDDLYFKRQFHLGVKVIGPFNSWLTYAGDDSVFFIAVGNNSIRRAIYDEFLEADANLCSLVSPDSCVSDSAIIGNGTLVMPGAIVNSDARIGVNAIINTGAIVEHDCVVGDHSHLAPRATLTGGAILGSNVIVGAGTVVCPGLRIGDFVQLGAGALVVEDVNNAGLYVGSPARLVRAFD
jgi:sugar O-acyltransferase (sialic acid O-acetyltransferase NeuD family)